MGFDEVIHEAPDFVEGELGGGVGGDAGVGVEGLGDFAGDDLGGGEALRVSVPEGERAVGEFGEGEDVAEEVFGEGGASGSEEGDLGPGRSFRTGRCLPSDSAAPPRFPANTPSLSMRKAARLAWIKERSR
ncbi:MAG TPA: hypothetical protein VFB21_11195 [Chthonomonadaceae bacterium]|nr:hypothetical protein [Chthonomonadaceae bacterium]